MSTLLKRQTSHDYHSARRNQDPAPVQAHRPDPSMEPIPDWSKLSREDDVTLYLGGQELASGRVDMRALDGSVLWIIHHDGRGRTMFLHSDGATAYRRPAKADKPRNRPFYKA
jgi:hypothetical protein